MAQPPTAGYAGLTPGGDGMLKRILEFLTLKWLWDRRRSGGGSRP